jgi:UDP-N-acetylglucosamine 2-epimerase (non-hydrolysing)
MLEQVLRIFDIQPDYDLAVMSPGQDLFEVTAKVIVGMRDVLDTVKPDVVLVQGDTTTALAAGVAAYYRQIPVGHVEAGLRTYRNYSPFPEEANRRMLSAVVDFHFAPTKQAKDNLLRERIDANTIRVTGNTVIDALFWMREKIRTGGAGTRWHEFFRHSHGVKVADDTKIILVTGHRRESFGRGFEHICRALARIARENENVDVVYPVHLNPNVREPVTRLLGGCSNIHLIPPQEYEPFVYLMMSCHIVLTDSGGIQEEAPSLGKPVLVMRDTTERPEGIGAGTVRLVGTDPEAIVNNTNRLLHDPEAYQRMATAVNPYGDGKATKRILEVLKSMRKDSTA